MAEMGGSVGIVAVGLGLGTAFAPTDERPAALAGGALGLTGYAAAALVLLLLPA
jgi:hypothetical protein